MLEEERFLVERPADPVRDCEGGGNGMAAEIRIETEESSCQLSANSTQFRTFQLIKREMLLERKIT